MYNNMKLEANQALTVKKVGPCKILQISKSSAVVEDITTRSISKLHFNHLHAFQYNENNLLPETWDEQISNIVSPNPRRSLRNSQSSQEQTIDVQPLQGN